jgi:3alpha(or 20beta)-hydroxysteroid dehydrogenase
LYISQTGSRARRITLELNSPGASGGTPLIDLSSHVAIVTGGARGIGAAVSRLFVEQGAAVVIADMLEAPGQALAAELGDKASFRRHDVTDESAWESLVAETAARFGRIDALVNCAGILITDAVVSFDRAQFEKVLQVNLVGTFLGIKHAARVMVKAGRGSIVNFSSSEGLQGSNSMAAYASSKWGVRGLTKVAAQELGAFGVRCNSVHPGPVNTPMLNPTGKAASELTSLSLFDYMPMRRAAEPLEIAQSCLYLVSDASGFVTGAELAIDGGLTLGMRLRNRPGGPTA